MRRPLLWVCLCLVALIAFGRYAGAPPDDGLPDGQRISVTGRIYQKDENSFYLKIQEIAAGSRQDNSKIISKIVHQIYSEDRLICEFEGAERLRLGSVVVLRGEIDCFSSATNPGEFDYRKYYNSLGFAGRLRETELLGCSESYSYVLEVLYRLKCYWKERLYRVFPEKEASVMTAILLGDKSDLDSDIKELYRENGIIHILSISGLHITVIGLGLYHLLRRLGAPVWLAAPLGGIVLVLYGILTGMSVSTCRAMGMYLLRMLAFLCGRTYDMLTALGVLAVILVCANPGYLGHMGFLLSFGSILGVGLLCPALTPTKEERGMVKKKYTEGKFRRICAALGEKTLAAAGEGLTAGISITLTTLPIQLWFNYEVPVYSVLLNVLILPLMSVVMSAGLAAMLVPGFGVVGTVDILILACYEGLCVLFEKLPFRTWNPGRPEVWKIVVYYVLWTAVVWGTDVYRKARKRRGAGTEGVMRKETVTWKRDGKRKGDSLQERNPMPREAVMRKKVAMLRAAAVWRERARAALLEHPQVILGAKIAALTVSVTVLGIPTFSGSRVTFLDVGQGDCICVQPSAGEVYLFDCGSSSRGKIGERVLIPFLKYYGIRRVNGVFLSHPDADHMNGLLELLALAEKEQIAVERIILPGIAEERRQEEFGELLAAVRAVPRKKEVEVAYVQGGDALWAAEKSAPRKKVEGESFICLHPAADFPVGDSNAYSECFYMKFENGFSLLLTGDVEGAGEAALLEELRRQGIGNVTVLKTAHHGSRNSTSEELLRQAAPRLAVISCGRNNRYGHPHEETLERLEQAGASVLRTDKSGAITVILKGRQIMVKTFCE